MSVPLIEESGGAAVSGSDSTQQFSSTASTSTSSGSRSSERRDLVTVHAGDGVTVSQEDLELLLVLAQTLLLAYWAYTEVST